MVVVQSVISVLQADVSNLKDIEELRAKVEHDLGAVSIVVNNAGLLFEPPLLEASEANHRRIIDVNLMSNFWVSNQPSLFKCLVNTAENLFKLVNHQRMFRNA